MNYDDIISKKVQNLKPSGIRKFFDIVAEMPDAISLGVGEPDFVTPWEIRDAAIKSIQKGHTSYTSNWGLIGLRTEIGLYLENNFNVSYNPENEILVTIGASEAIDLTLRTIINNGDCVLVPEPSYVSYVPNIELCGGVAVPIKTNAELKFKLTYEAVEAAITPSCKAIILPYPNNPTGAIMERHELEAILPLIKKHNLIVLADEIYGELTYGKRHVSIASLEGMKERTILISGFSKAFAMTGWRVGYVAAPKEFMKMMVKIHQYTIMCASTMSQYAALAALTTGRNNNYMAVEEMRLKYDMRRRFLVQAFLDMGLDCFMPEGAFYVFPCIKKSGLSGDSFAEKLLTEKNVAVVPGSAFGECGENFIRCSYASSMATLSEAATRISDFLQKR